MTTGNIVYKALGFKWLSQAFCPASAFVSADRNEARNPQRFIVRREADHRQNKGLHAVNKMVETFVS